MKKILATLAALTLLSGTALAEDSLRKNSKPDKNVVDVIELLDGINENNRYSFEDSKERDIQLKYDQGKKFLEVEIINSKFWNASYMKIRDYDLNGLEDDDMVRFNYREGGAVEDKWTPYLKFGTLSESSQEKIKADYSNILFEGKKAINQSLENWKDLLERKVDHITKD